MDVARDEPNRKADVVSTGGKADRPRVEIFDPPLCCPTGVCGPAPDPALLDISEAILALKADGVSVARYSLNAQPQAFIANPEVYRLVRGGSLSVLPITVVDGRVVKKASYPSLGELRESLARTPDIAGNS